jgi:NADPH:quinone reductase-like Zn-dependent oxidoreductase
MKAVVVHGYGPPESLRYEEFPDPTAPDEGEILVRVVAASVNPADGRLSSGEYPGLWTSFPRVNGRDVAGIVVAVGPSVTDYRIGDRIFGFSELDRPGTWADFVVMQVRAVGLAPRSVSLTEAAALPVVAMTAWLTLFVDFHLAAGQTLLINGAGGGVGAVAVQMAKGAGAQVIGSASAEKLPFLRKLGCDEVIDYRKTPIDSVLGGLDAVLDCVGGDSLRRSYGVIKRGGWLASLSGPTDPEAAASAGITASQTFGRVEQGLLATIAREVDASKLKVNVSAVFPMSEAPLALKQLNQGHTLGKIVVVND